MIDSYIAEKDGLTTYISPEMMNYYSDQGYTIYKLKKIEIPFNQIGTEIESVIAEINKEKESNVYYARK